MTVFEYKTVPVESLSTKRLQTTLAELGGQGWDLVAVDNGVCYFKRGPDSQDNVYPGYGENDKSDSSVTYELDQPRDSRIHQYMSSTDGEFPHSHTVKIVVLGDGTIHDQWVETVFEHTHEVVEMGMLGKAMKHTHTFDEIGGDDGSED